MNTNAYSRPNKPRTLVTRERSGVPAMALPEIAAPICVDGATECHVTPMALGGRMTDYLGPLRGCSVLDPSAGTGNLIAALLAAGQGGFDMVAVERHYSLIEGLETRFENVDNLTIHQGCFLDYAGQDRQRRFDRIIMNPPFRQVKKHMQAAVSLLKNGGVLVALVPITFNPDGFEDLETLDRETFSSAQVSAKLVLYEA